MNEQFTRHTEQFFKAAQEARIPENIQSFAADSLERTRAAYDTMAAAAKTSAKTLESVTSEAQTGAKSLAEKIIANMHTNTEAVFEAARAMVKAKSLPEIAKLQADFVTSQFAKAGEQTREVFELSAKITKDTVESLNGVAMKGFGK